MVISTSQSIFVFGFIVFVYPTPSIEPGLYSHYSAVMIQYRLRKNIYIFFFTDAHAFSCRDSWKVELISVVLLSEDICLLLSVVEVEEWC